MAKAQETIACIVGVALLSTGCWSTIRGPRVVSPQPAVANSGFEIVLSVAEAGVSWSDGSLGREIADGLSGEGFLVYYPVEPASAPPLRVEVRALGGEDPAIIWGLIGSAVIGYFYFGPVLIWPFFDTYGTTCMTRVLYRGEELHHFTVESKATSIHALFADAQKRREEARVRVFRDLGRKIAAEVAAVQKPLAQGAREPHAVLSSDRSSLSATRFSAVQRRLLVDSRSALSASGPGEVPR